MDPIDIALESYPLVELPSGFTRHVMARVNSGRVLIPSRTSAQARISAPARFRLDFLDFALPAFFAWSAAILLGTGLWILGRADPLWLAYANMRLAVLQFQLERSPGLPLWVTAGILVSVVVAGAAGVISWLVLSSPRLVHRHSQRQV